MAKSVPVTIGISLSMERIKISKLVQNFSKTF